MHLECLQQHLHGISTLALHRIVPEICVGGFHHLIVSSSRNKDQSFGGQGLDFVCLCTEWYVSVEILKHMH